MACSVIGILFSMLRVFARFERSWSCARGSLVQQKTPRAGMASEGSASVRSLGISGSSSGRPSSADALSKYENSGAHGTDPPPGAHLLSSGWDSRLIM
ncbi:hypothetical protein GTW40_08535 [Streptomyces sp. SID4985]|nr:hypothetical protein [Streptomyces sp. SID4985]